jgi:hypothetical protein
VCKIWDIIENSSNSFDVPCIHCWQPFEGKSVTAIAIWNGPFEFQGRTGYLIVVGSEEGVMKLFFLNEALDTVEMIQQIPLPYCHGKTVRRLAWRQSTPRNNNNQRENEENVFEFASCSEDNSVRIHRVTIN